MAKTLVALEEDDARLLLSLLDKEKKNQRNESPTAPQERPSPSPEVYVARVPINGIPPLSRAGSSGNPTSYDIPGSAYCTIYKVMQNSVSGEYQLIPINGFQKLILNISQSWVDSLYAIVQREKFGSWVVECPCVDITGTATSTSTSTGSTGTGSTGTGSTGTGSTGTGSTGTGSTGTGSTGTGSTGTGSTGTGSTGTGSTGTATSTSTGTDGTASGSGNCTGTCSWEWVGGAWSGPVFSNCSAGCTCQQPVTGGLFEGESRPGTCA